MNFNISNLASVLFQVNKTVNNTKSIDKTTEKFEALANKQAKLDNITAKALDGLYLQVANSATRIMNNIQQNIFLRDMLGLPKDWSILLNQFLATSNNPQLANMLKNLNSLDRNNVQNSLLALLNSNASVDLKALAMQLKLNSNSMADKLLKQMGEFNMTQQNIAQLKTIMTIGASIANNVEVNPQEFLRDILQMYLPWLPLVPPKESDLNEIENKTAPIQNNDAQVLFYLSTDNLGYFKIEILKDNEIGIYINNVCEKTDDDLKKSLCAQIKENIKNSSIDAKLYFSSKIDRDKLNKKEKQLYIVNSTNSLIELTLIQLLARVIFEFDEKEGLRFSKVQEN